MKSQNIFKSNDCVIVLHNNPYDSIDSMAVA